jgi:hypothetical protein
MPGTKYAATVGESYVKGLSDQIYPDKGASYHNYAVFHVPSNAKVVRIEFTAADSKGDPLTTHAVVRVG